MAADTAKVLLLGGTSHTGKSTLGRQLAGELGWRLLSTDQLARHPGRPWRDDGSAVPDDVAHHYGTLTTSGLVDSVSHHYRDNVWPIVAAVTRSHVNNPFDPGLVLERSAILPDLVATAGASLQGACWMWLHVPERVLTDRIRASSGFAGRSADEQRLVSAFLARTLEFQRTLSTSVQRSGMQQLDATAPRVLEQLVAWVRRGEI